MISSKVNLLILNSNGPYRIKKYRGVICNVDIFYFADNYFLRRIEKFASNLTLRMCRALQLRLGTSAQSNKRFFTFLQDHN